MRRTAALGLALLLALPLAGAHPCPLGPWLPEPDLVWGCARAPEPRGAVLARDDVTEGGWARYEVVADAEGAMGSAWFEWNTTASTTLAFSLWHQPEGAEPAPLMGLAASRGSADVHAAAPGAEARVEVLALPHGHGWTEVQLRFEPGVHVLTLVAGSTGGLRGSFSLVNEEGLALTEASHGPASFWRVRDFEPRAQVLASALGVGASATLRASHPWTAERSAYAWFFSFGIPAQTGRFGYDGPDGPHFGERCIAVAANIVGVQHGGACIYWLSAAPAGGYRFWVQSEALASAFAEDGLLVADVPG